MNTKKSKYNIVITLLFLLVPIGAFSHGDLTIRIKQLTEEISKNPKNPILYYERGILFKEHFEFVKALKDFKKSEKYGNKSKALQFQKSETLFDLKHYKKALKVIDIQILMDKKDVKALKLKAQILNKLNRNHEALQCYKYVLNNMVSIRPKDIIEYTDIILAIDHKNYNAAIEAINLGLAKLGENTVSLQIKKLDFLIASKQTEKIISQYNYFILNNKRKEFWYYKKAMFLYQIQKKEESIVAIHQAKLSIELLSPRFKNMGSVKNLQKHIIELENKIDL